MDVKGLGVCLIPKENGQLCSRQIEEGEPIGTVVVGVTPFTGHHACAQAYEGRKAAKKETGMVKRVDQQGPGGAVDMTTGTDAVMGSTPLEKSPGSEDKPDLSSVPMPPGVTPITDLPFEEPVDTWSGGRPDPVDLEQLTASRRQSMAEEAGQGLFDATMKNLESDSFVDKHQQTQIDHRFRYHPPTPSQARIQGLIREQARSYAYLLVDLCPESPERAAAIDALDTAVMLANASIARHGHA